MRDLRVACLILWRKEGSSREPPAVRESLAKGNHAVRQDRSPSVPREIVAASACGTTSESSDHHRGLILRIVGKHAARTVSKVNVALVIRQRFEQLELDQVLRSKSFRLQSRPSRDSETFHHPDIAVGDVAQYGKVAAVRRRYAPN